MYLLDDNDGYLLCMLYVDFLCTDEKYHTSMNADFRVNLVAGSVNSEMMVAQLRRLFSPSFTASPKTFPRNWESWCLMLR